MQYWCGALQHTAGKASRDQEAELVQAMQSNPKATLMTRAGWKDWEDTLELRLVELCDRSSEGDKEGEVIIE